MLEAFKIIQGDEIKIKKNTLKYQLSNGGDDPLTEHETKLLIELADPNDTGKIHFE